MFSRSGMNTELAERRMNAATGFATERDSTDRDGAE